jgi:protein-disulfide isomerase
MMKPLRLLRALAIACGLAATLTPLAAAAQDLSADQRKQIEGVVRDYLLKNPEILQEAFAELQKRQDQAERAGQKDALASEKSALLDAKDHTVVGNPKGDVTLVEFFDYNCPYCRKMGEDIVALTKRDPNVRIILRDFPILSEKSTEASQAAIAVRRQLKPEKFLAFHEKLLAAKGQLGKEETLKIAKEFGVDTAKAEKDMADPAIAAELKEALRLGRTLNITGTPTFIVGEDIAPGAVSLEQLQDMVKAARQKG